MSVTNWFAKDLARSLSAWTVSMDVMLLPGGEPDSGAVPLLSSNRSDVALFGVGTNVRRARERMREV